jgi:hypothetical protein
MHFPLVLGEAPKKGPALCLQARLRFLLARQREQVANALVNKGITLGALGPSEDEIAVFDDVLAPLRRGDRITAARTSRQCATK